MSQQNVKENSPKSFASPLPQEKKTPHGRPWSDGRGGFTYHALDAVAIGRGENVSMSTVATSYRFVPLLTRMLAADQNNQRPGKRLEYTNR